jgi:cytoskeletal protein RodZ
MHEDEVLFTEFFNHKLKERGFTLKQLSDTTGIAIKHLENFGNGRFEHLPSAPYVHGYFVKLGDILGFDPDEWWDRIKEEDTVHRSGAADRMPDNRFNRLQGRALLWGLIIVGLVGIYIAARFTTIIGEPRLILTEPTADISSVSASTLVFRGTIKNGDSLTIDGASVYLSQDGSFSADVLLRPGANTIELKAKKILGREITLTREVYYDDSQIIAPAPAGLQGLPVIQETQASSSEI